MSKSSIAVFKINFGYSGHLEAEKLGEATFCSLKAKVPIVDLKFNKSFSPGILPF